MRTNQRLRRIRNHQTLDCVFPRSLLCQYSTTTNLYHLHSFFITNTTQGTDPGILINIYQTLTTYQIPGPTPFVCGASGSSPPTSSKAGATTSKATTTPTTLATSTKVTSTAVASSTGGTAPLYGQCGGSGWTGPTTCASGTCKASGTYYSEFYFSIMLRLQIANLVRSMLAVSGFMWEGLVVSLERHSK